MALGHGNVYSDFLDIMRFSRKGDMDMPGAEAQREVSVHLHGHTDLLEEFMHFVPDAMVAENVHYNQLGRDYILRHDSGVSLMINAISLLKKPAPVSIDEQKQISGIVLKNKTRNEKIVTGMIGNMMVMDNTRKSARIDHYVTDQVYGGMQDLVSTLREKVNEKLQDPDTNEKISDCLRSHIRKIFTSSEFHMLVASLLGNHADIMKECKVFPVLR